MLASPKNSLHLALHLLTSHLVQEDNLLYPITLGGRMFTIQDDQLEYNGRTMSRRKADEVPNRAFKMLYGLARYPNILGVMAQAGYRKQDQEEGWNLLRSLTGLEDGTPILSDVHQEAVAVLNQWDEPNFTRAKAALENRYPAQFAYIFKNLEPAQGAGAVLSVGTFLDRVQALKDGSDDERKDFREQDKAAAELLYTRMILSDDIVKELRGHIKNAQQLPEIFTTKSEEDEIKKIFALDAWYQEWSQTAKAVINKRGYLISLGLASRRKPKEEGPS